MKDATDAKKRTFKEWRKDQTADTRAAYNMAKKRAKKAEARARKEASEKLICDLEADKSSSKIFKVAKQAVKDGKDVLGNGYVRDELGTLCVGESEKTEVWKRHMEKVMNKEND